MMMIAQGQPGLYEPLTQKLNNKKFYHTCKEKDCPEQDPNSFALFSSPTLCSDFLISADEQIS